MMTKQGFDELETNLKKHVEDQLDPIKQEIRDIQKKLNEIEYKLNFYKQRLDDLIKEGAATKGL